MDRIVFVDEEVILRMKEIVNYFFGSTAAVVVAGGSNGDGNKPVWNMDSIFYYLSEENRNRRRVEIIFFSGSLLLQINTLEESKNY